MSLHHEDMWASLQQKLCYMNVQLSIFCLPVKVLVNEMGMHARMYLMQIGYY